MASFRALHAVRGMQSQLLSGASAWAARWPTDWRPPHRHPVPSPDLRPRPDPSPRLLLRHPMAARRSKCPPRPRMRTTGSAPVWILGATKEAGLDSVVRLSTDCPAYCHRSPGRSRRSQCCPDDGVTLSRSPGCCPRAPAAAEDSAVGSGSGSGDCAVHRGAADAGAAVLAQDAHADAAAAPASHSGHSRASRREMGFK